MKNIYVTIDTEADADIHWIKKEPLEFLSITEGIPNYLRPLFNKVGINPLYFVSYEVLQDENACNVLRQEIKNGAAIGAHLHPEYQNESVSNKEQHYPFPALFLSFEEEENKIRILTREIENKLDVKPTWYRAARFGADIDTMKILEKLGYLSDSSVTPGIDWTNKGGINHGKGTCGDYFINENDYYSKLTDGRTLNICEHPVTIMGKRFGILGKMMPDNWLFYRWFRPTHMFLFELKQMIDIASERQIELVMMFHSMEVMVNKSPYVRNRFMQYCFLSRIEKSILYAKERGYKAIW